MCLNPKYKYVLLESPPIRSLPYYVRTSSIEASIDHLCVVPSLKLFQNAGARTEVWLVQQRRLVQSRLPKAWSCRHWSAPFFVPWNSNVTNSYVNSCGVGAMQTPNGLIRNWFLNQFGRAYIQMSKTPNELLMCGWRLFGFKVSQTPNGLLRNWFLNQFGRAYPNVHNSQWTPNVWLTFVWFQSVSNSYWTAIGAIVFVTENRSGTENEGHKLLLNAY